MSRHAYDWDDDVTERDLRYQEIQAAEEISKKWDDAAEAFLLIRNTLYGRGPINFEYLEECMDQLAKYFEVNIGFGHVHIKREEFGCLNQQGVSHDAVRAY